MPEYRAGVHRFVVFRKVSGGLEAGGGEEGKEAQARLITSVLPMEKGEVLSFNSMSNLIAAAEKGGGKMKKMASLPQVKARTKKLEEAERAKRERVENRSSGNAKPKTKTTPNGAFGAGSIENDGSKEGRKAERDRRREELLKSNPNYKELTPEQKTEIERKRRERMAEEEAKWNIAPEDAPEEGDVEEGDGGYELGDEEDGGDDEDLDEDLDEGEDVMDLD